MIYEFRFWKEWCDEEGRLWAEPYTFEASSDARRSHKGALGWDWVMDRLRPSVSDLYSIAYTEDPATGKKREQSRTVIQDGGVREFHEATLSGMRASGDRDEMFPASAAARTSAKPDRLDTPF